MSTVRAVPLRRSHARRGFTLVELLVVIAIIALLAALLFPAFTAVREKSRQATALSNLHEIQVGMAQYQLDHHAYPPVLFGYALAGASMQTALQQAQAGGANVVSQYFPGVYPRYVNDYRAFEDPNNSASDGDASATASVTVSTLSGSTLTSGTQTFYTADAYDTSPMIVGGTALSTTTYLPRYQLSWTPIGGTAAADTADYQRQLRWRSQPGDTYVTCTTYHVPNAGKVIVLFESGTAKVMDVSTFLATDPSNTDSVASFWKVRP